MNDCLFGCNGAVGIFYLPKGCLCWPDVKTQILCWQHAGDSAHFGGIRLIQDLTEDDGSWFSKWWHGQQTVKQTKRMGQRGFDRP